MTEKTNEQRAKSILRKYKIVLCIDMFSLLALLFFVLLEVESLLLKFIVLVSVFFCVHFLSAILFMRFIFPVLTKEMNAPLYYEIAKKGKVSFQYQVIGEYFIGNYVNVIALCRKKLENKKISANDEYFSLNYLANTYFVLGEDEYLKEICDRFYAKLSTDKRREKIFRIFRGFEFYSVYLNGNIEACESFLRKKEKDPLSLVSYQYKEARVALMKGETEEAKALFAKTVSEAPLLHYSTLSAAALEGMENGVEYREAAVSLCKSSDSALFLSENRTSEIHLIKKITLIVGIVAIVIYMCAVALLNISEDFQGDFESWEDEIEIAVETDMGDVEMLKTFDLEKGFDYVESMFICKNGDTVFLGAAYYLYEDEEAYYADDYTVGYDIFAEIPLSTLMAEDFDRVSHEYKAVSSAYTIKSIFVKTRRLSGDFEYKTYFEIDGVKFCFAVTELRYRQSV